MHLSRTPCWPIDTTYFTQPSSELSLEYIYYILRSLNLQSLDRSTAIPGLNRDDLYAQRISLPPLPEQRRIVAEIEKQFTRLDAGVAALKRVQANLKRYRGRCSRPCARAGWHPRIPPTNRQIACWRASWPSGARSGRRSIRKKYVEPAVPETDGLPELPVGWCWATVQQLAADEPNSITDGPFGSNLKTEHYTSTGPRVIRLQNIGDGEFHDEQAHISQQHFERLRRHEVFANDLVIAGLGETLPRACIIPSFVGPAIVKADCIRFKPHEELADVRYLNAALNSEVLKKVAARIVHGVGRPRMNQQEIRSLSVPLPPLVEQHRIAAEVERRLSVVVELEATVAVNLARAGRLRQAVLKRAFEGRLVAQGASDEPTGVLLARIQTARDIRRGVGLLAHAVRDGD